MLWLALIILIAVAGLLVANWLTAENLPATWCEERRLQHRSLTELDAACQANPVDSGLVVSLTTIPSRLVVLDGTLKSLLQQSARPREIRVCLPEWSRREQRAYVVPDWLRALRSVTVVRGDDEGPATKFLPTLRSVPPDQPVVIVDDDRIYHPRLLESYRELVRTHPDEVISAAGWRVPADRIDRPTTLWRRLRGEPYVPIRANQVTAPHRVDIVQGVHSYVLRGRFFDLTALGDFSAAPAAVRFVDDIWVSGHCQAPCVVHPLSLGYTDFKPWGSRALYNATSLGGTVNSAARDADRGNSLALRHFAERWRASPGQPGSSNEDALG